MTWRSQAICTTTSSGLTFTTDCVRGWDATAVSAAALMARNDRFIPADLDDATPQSVFVDARLR